MFSCHQAVWLIKPGRVLYKKLQDFTVGHAFLLEAMDSPFMKGGKITIFDLAVAVLLCSMPFRKARAILQRPPYFLSRLATRWGLYCRLRGFKIGDEIQKFMDYISAYTEMPEIWVDKKKKGKKSAVPFSLRLAWTLMSKMDEEEAWNCPLVRALGYYTAEAEFNGAEFVTEEQDKLIEAIEEDGS